MQCLWNGYTAHADILLKAFCHTLHISTSLSPWEGKLAKLLNLRNLPPQMLLQEFQTEWWSCFLIWFSPHFLRVKVPFIILGWDMLWVWLPVLFHVLNTFIIMALTSMNLQRDFQWILSSLQRNVNLDFWVQNPSQFSFPPWERCNVENWCSVKILWQFWPRETAILMADNRTQNFSCSTILFLFFYKICGQCWLGSSIIQHFPGPGAINCSCFISCFHLFKSIFQPYEHFWYS